MASEEMNHSLLSRSPSPTLIYPMPPAHLPGTDDISDLTLGWSQNSVGCLGGTVPRSQSELPEERKLRQRERRSLKEISLMCRSVDNAAVVSSTPSRSTVVTDIDEAMAHMDQVYLKTLFNDTSNKSQHCVAAIDVTCSSSCDDDGTEETNIDDEPSSTMTILRQKAQNQHNWSKETRAEDSASCDGIVLSSQVCMPFSLETDPDKEQSKLECSCG